MLSTKTGQTTKRAARPTRWLLSWTLLVFLIAISPSLAATNPANDAQTQRLARTEAWRAQQEAETSADHLTDNGRLAPDPVGGDWLPPGAAATSAVLGGDLGGEEIVVGALDTRPEAMLEITSTGVIYVATPPGSSGFGPDAVNIYRSADGGRTFQLWSAFTNPDPDGILDFDDFVIAEGTSDRAFVAYSAGEVWNSSIRVAWAELTPSAPVWNHVTVETADTGFYYRDIDLETDAGDFADYFVYLSATGWIGDSHGTAIWFCRSQNMGSSWETGYAPVSNPSTAPTKDAVWSDLSYGSGGFVHLTYRTIGEGITRVGYRRAASFADAGLPSWSNETVIFEGVWADGDHSRPLALEASRVDGTVLIHRDLKLNDIHLGTHLQWSTDNGATWPAANIIATGVEAETDLNTTHGAININPVDGSVFFIGRNPTAGSENLGFQTQRTTTATPGSLSPPDFWVSPEYPYAIEAGGDIAGNPARGGQRAVVWQAAVGAYYQVYFDAEWLREPGWPNTEPGFPLALGGIGRTPPAIADVDDDPFGEIIFATEEGLVYVVNHDGTMVDGWPVDLSEAIAWDAPVAVGDLNGDDVPEVVIGTAAGRVFAYSPDGTILPGWPINLGTNADTFVSIGALGPPYARYVVACSGDRFRAFRYDGEDVSNLWGFGITNYVRPAAIGDVDGDGVGEIVVRQLGSIHVHSLDSFNASAFRAFSGETLSGMPALADMDGDGDLEIAVGTTEGKVYLMHHDFSDYSPAFPYDTGNVSAISGVVIVNLLGTSTPELVFSQVDGTTHIVWENGNPGIEYPKSVAPNEFIYMPPIVTSVNRASPNVVVSAGSSLYSWQNTGGLPDGWPRDVGDFIEESAAAGDIDLDGNIEIVALGLGELRVFDVGNPPNSGILNPTWPMYGFNAQRTGCLGCVEDVVSAVDDPAVAAPSRLAFAPPFPNPASARTALSYALPVTAQVKLQIFDVRGRLIRTLADGQQEAGHHEAFWNGTGAGGRRVALGMYLAKLSVSGPGVQEERVRKISLVR